MRLTLALLVAAMLCLTVGCQSAMPQHAAAADATPLQAAAPQEPAKPAAKPTIGVVDIDEVLKSDLKFISDQLEVYDDCIERGRRLTKDFESATKALREKQSLYRFLSEEYAKAEEELIALKCAYDYQLGVLSVDLTADYRANVRDALARISKVLNKLAADQQLVLVLDKSMKPVTASVPQWLPERPVVLYCGETVDLTEQVKIAIRDQK